MIVLSAFAVAAAAGPVIAATTLAPSAPHTVQAAPGECLAWFNNQGDGHCLGYSNGNETNIGSPWGIYGPNNYQNGGLLPGQTFNRGFN